MTTFYRDVDIAGMLNEFSVPVLLEGVTANGIVDYSDAVTFRDNGIGGVINKAITVSVQTSAFPSLALSNATGLPVTVDGVAYTIRERLQQGDGAITHLMCTN